MTLNLSYNLELIFQLIITFFFDFLANIRINVYLCGENIKYTYDYGKTYSTNTCFERTGCN